MFRDLRCRITNEYKTCNGTAGITQSPKHTKQERFRYDVYLAITSSVLLSYVIGVDPWLGGHCDFFRLRWEKLGCPLPYLTTSVVEVRASFCLDHDSSTYIRITPAAGQYYHTTHIPGPLSSRYAKGKWLLQNTSWFSVSIELE